LKAILERMRSLISATAAFVVCAPLAGAFAAGTAGGQQPAHPKNPAPAPTIAPASTTVPDNDAAAKHAKRTACLKETKAKKLVGAQKNSFIKDCMARP
jgi:hypothetical protein